MRHTVFEQGQVPRVSFSWAGAGGQKAGQGSGPVFTRSLDFICYPEPKRARGKNVLMYSSEYSLFCFLKRSL